MDNLNYIKENQGRKSIAEPRFFTLTKVPMAKFCDRHMGEISVMDQNILRFYDGS